MSDFRAELSAFLGGCCPLPTALNKGTVEIKGGAGVLSRLLSHWRSVPLSTLPRLRGLSVSREAGGRRKLLLLLGFKGNVPGVLLSLDAEKPGQGVSEIWPHALWWEEELRCFEGLEFGNETGPGGIAWRRS